MVDDGKESNTWHLLEEDAKYFIHQALSTPCLNVLDKCSGSYITDKRGRSMLDFHGNSVHQVGFGNQYVINAIITQLQTLPFCTRRYTNEPAIKLAKMLSDLAPGDLSRVLFTPSGTASIGVAMKLARMYTKRHKTVSLWESFHGASLDAISIGGEAIFRKDIGPLLPGSEHVPPADEYRCLFGCREPGRKGSCEMRCASYLEYVLEREGDVAAVIAEPVRWTPYVPRKEYWERVRRACDKYGTLLIFDEIPNSLGRTGTMFTCEEYVVPDILVLGKGLGGGVLPMSAVIAREKLNECAKHVALGHYTHEKNPVRISHHMLFEEKKLTICHFVGKSMQSSDCCNCNGQRKLTHLHEAKNLNHIISNQDFLSVNVRFQGSCCSRSCNS
eukprot:c6184_g1_i2.p1 GENE.c6184_g1_i2~~c6184_g1_i2.p1  ORF type:complete len:452 (+),score=70.45 c6184_g1_i2:197-1357(+)